MDVKNFTFPLPPNCTARIDVSMKAYNHNVLYIETYEPTISRTTDNRNQIIPHFDIVNTGAKDMIINFKADMFTVTSGPYDNIATAHSFDFLNGIGTAKLGWSETNKPPYGAITVVVKTERNA